MSDQPKISRDELAQMLLYSAKNLFTANGKNKGLVSLCISSFSIYRLFLCQEIIN